MTHGDEVIAATNTNHLHLLFPSCIRIHDTILVSVQISFSIPNITPHMNPPKLLSTEVIFTHRWAGTITKELYQLPDKDQPFDFYRRQSSDIVTILVITPDEQCVLTHQYRFGVGHIVTDICGGGVEPNEDPREAAVREMNEESGYSTNPEDFILMTQVPVNTARTSNTRYIYLARNAQQTQEQHLDEFERISLSLEPFETVLSKVLDGEYTEPNFQLAVLLYQQKYRLK